MAATMIHLRPRHVLCSAILALSVFFMCTGCTGKRGGFLGQASGPQIQSVACMYGKSPWLNYDKAGDMDPEGIVYRVFLDPGTGTGVEADGTFHIEMYELERDTTNNEFSRVLVSDWHYPTSQFSRVKSKYLGIGYLLKLRWAKKSLAGKEVELITRYEGGSGVITAAGTKRLRIPRYNS